MKPGQRRNSLALRFIKVIGLRSHSSLTIQRDPAGLTVKPALRAETTVLTGQFIHQPEPGIMAGLGVIGAGLPSPTTSRNNGVASGMVTVPLATSSGIRLPA